MVISGFVSVESVSFPWFLLYPCTLGACGACALPGRKFSVDLFPLFVQLVFSQYVWA